MAEGLVIVVSILLAFGVDAWWDGQRERREVAQELESVARELKENEVPLASQIDLLGRAIRASDEVLAQLRANPGTAHVPVPDTLALLAITSPTLDLSLGAVDALIAGGRLAAVENRELRVRLSSLRALIQDATEHQETNRQLYENQMLPLLTDDTLYDHDVLWDVAGPFFQSRAGSEFESLGLVQFPNTQRLRGLIRERRGQNGISVAELKEIDLEFKALREMIETDK